MKLYRIYRAASEGKQKVNTYLEYFDTLEEAKAAPNPDSSEWRCFKVRYEKLNTETNKWLPIST